MITLNKISINKLPEVIEIAYEGDNDLFEKYHVQRFTLKESVISTLKMINDTAKEYKTKCYKVIYNKQSIGYVALYGDILYSFGINIRFRKKDILLAWWNEIKKEIGNTFICQLYNNNTRAIEFLKKQGMKVIEENKQYDFITLLNSK